jgi:hypothetical protein
MRFRDYIRVAGFLILMFGVLCLPTWYEGSPKRDTSVFNNFADMGFFLTTALVLIPIGIIVLVLSYLPAPSRKNKTR